LAAFALGGILYSAVPLRRRSHRTAQDALHDEEEMVTT
jgi:hypothetical protein